MSKAQQPTVGEQTYVVNLLGVDVGGAGFLDMGRVNGGGFGGEGVHDARRTADRALMVTAPGAEESATAWDR